MLTMKINLPQMEIELIPPWNNLYRPFPSSSPALTPPRHLSPPDVAIVCGAEAPASVQQTRPPFPSRPFSRSDTRRGHAGHSMGSRSVPSASLAATDTVTAAPDIVAGVLGAVSRRAAPQWAGTDTATMGVAAGTIGMLCVLAEYRPH